MGSACCSTPDEDVRNQIWRPISNPSRTSTGGGGGAKSDGASVDNNAQQKLTSSAGSKKAPALSFTQDNTVEQVGGPQQPGKILDTNDEANEFEINQKDRLF